MTDPTVPAWPTNDPTPPVIDTTDPTSGDFPEAQSTVPPYIVVPADPSTGAGELDPSKPPGGGST